MTEIREKLEEMAEASTEDISVETIDKQETMLDKYVKDAIAKQTKALEDLSSIFRTSADNGDLIIKANIQELSNILQTLEEVSKDSVPDIVGLSLTKSLFGILNKTKQKELK